MYALIAPDQRLRPYIESYWFLRVVLEPGSSFTEWLAVDAQPDILFNFGTPYTRRVITLGSESVVSASNLDGQRRVPVQVVQAGAIDLLGVRFRPGGLSAFVRMPLSHLSDALHAPGDVLGGHVDALEDALYHAPGPAARAALLDAWFLRRLHPRTHHLLFNHILSTIQASHGMVRVEALSAAYSYSARTLNRMFNDYAGLPAKTYLRITRFQHAAALVAGRNTATLADIALAAGYYDQAHFTREFIQFSGVSPEKYATAQAGGAPQPV
jgi:AraC-like DNA-binding protein